MSANTLPARSTCALTARLEGERLLIFSRKGFDSSFGGWPSPRLPDGRLVSMPIPEPHSPITYGNSMVQPGLSYAGLLGKLGISYLTKPLGGGLARLPVTADLGAHLDPDLRASARPRPAGWQPLFGQSEAAQRHLSRQGVGPGDVFVFFGWFRDAEDHHGQYRYARPHPPAGNTPRPCPDYQAIWGWMEIGEVLPAPVFAERHSWAAGEHPHLIASLAGNNPWANTIYMAAQHFSLDPRLPGAGTMHYSDRSRLTAPDARSRRWWSLPDYFHPAHTSRRMTYQPPGAWSSPTGGRVTLRSACIGQEFVVPMNDAISAWLTDLITRAQPW
jgi:hypothetical protein